MVPKNDFCGTCCGKATQECAGCHNMRYCSRECQKEDWPVHKHLCKTFVDFATPPGPNLRRIIMLPQDSKVPYFSSLKTFSSETEEPEEQWLHGLKLKYAAHPDLSQTDETPGHELSSFRDVFGSGSIAFPVPFDAGKLGVPGREHFPDRGIYGIFDKTQPAHTRKLNQCVVSMLGDRATAPSSSFCRGNLAIFTMTNVSKPKFILDADCSDLVRGDGGLVHMCEEAAATGLMGNASAKEADEANTAKSSPSADAGIAMIQDEMDQLMRRTWRKGGLMSMINDMPNEMRDKEIKKGETKVLSTMEEEAIDAFLKKFEEVNIEDDGENEDEDVAEDDKTAEDEKAVKDDKVAREDKVAENKVNGNEK